MSDPNKQTSNTGETANIPDDILDYVDKAATGEDKSFFSENGYADAEEYMNSGSDEERKIKNNLFEAHRLLPEPERLLQYKQAEEIYSKAIGRGDDEQYSTDQAVDEAVAAGVELELSTILHSEVYGSIAFSTLEDSEKASVERGLYDGDQTAIDRMKETIIGPYRTRLFENVMKCIELRKALFERVKKEHSSGYDSLAENVPFAGDNDTSESDGETGDAGQETVGYREVDTKEYVEAGLADGSLEVFEATKYARIAAVQGEIGQEVISWSEDADGNPIQEKVAKVEADPETGEPGWVVTKTDGEGKPVIDKNGHTNQWIIEDSKFKKKYEVDPDHPDIFKPVGGPQKFVQTKENLTLFQWGEKENIAKGGYINITDPNDMYGISARDFDSTYARTEQSSAEAPKTPEAAAKAELDALKADIDSIDKEIEETLSAAPNSEKQE